MGEDFEDRLIAAFNRIADVAEKWYKATYPEEKPKRAGEVHRSDDDKRQHLSDKPDANWIEETEKALPPSRFQERFEESTKEAERKGRSDKKAAKG